MDKTSAPVWLFLLVAFCLALFLAGCGGGGAGRPTGTTPNELPAIIGEIPRDEFLAAPVPTSADLKQAMTTLGWMQATTPLRPAAGQSRALFDAARRIAGGTRSPGKFYDLTLQEWALILAHPGRAIAVAIARDEAYAEAQKRYGVFCSSDRANAFLHAYWNARMAANLLAYVPTPGDPDFDVTRDPVQQASDMAEQFANAHESANPPGDRETAMDLVNNEVGRTVFRNHAGASAGEIADILERYRTVQDDNPARHSGSTDALVYISDACGNLIVYRVSSSVREAGWRGWDHPYFTTQSRSFGPEVGAAKSWFESFATAYTEQFTGDNFMKGTISQQKLQVDMQAQFDMNHPGGGMVAFGDVTAQTTVEVFALDRTQEYQLKLTRTSSRESASDPDDGRPGTGKPGSAVGLTLNGTPVADGTSTFTLTPDREEDLVLKPGALPVRYHRIAVISGSAVAPGGFSAIMFVPPIHTLSKAVLGIKAEITRKDNP